LARVKNAVCVHLTFLTLKKVRFFKKIAQTLMNTDRNTSVFFLNG
jgi:hypothetical protein